MLSRNDENMHWCLWAEVIEGYYIFVTIDVISWDITVCYFAENTFAHKFFIASSVFRLELYTRIILHTIYFYVILGGTSICAYVFSLTLLH